MPVFTTGMPVERADGTIDQLQVEKSSVLFFKTIVFNALIPNILLSRLSDEQKMHFSHLKPADFETVYDWSISPWRNNLDIPWCNQDYFTNKVCSAGKSDRRRYVTQGNPLRPSEWGFKIGWFPNIYGDFCTFSCFSLDTEDQIF